MTREHHWTYDQTTRQFLRGGPWPYDPRPLRPGEAIIVLIDHAPDPRTERCDPDTASTRAAAAAEIAAYDLAVADQEATRELGLKALRALAQATYELKSNAWTATQFRDRIKAIYKTLS